MPKIVYHDTWGSFWIPEEIFRRYCELKNLEFEVKQGPCGRELYINGEWQDEDDDPIERSDWAYVQAVEEFPDYGLAVTDEIPSGTRYRIEHYDGKETVITLDEINWRIA
jgi:hypothetical protein